MVSELYTDNNRLQCKTPRNFPVTRFTEEMSSSFSSLAHFPLIFCDTLVAASISHFLTTATKISCCSSKIKCLLFFISRSSSLSLFVLFTGFTGLVRTFSFSASKDTGGYAISCQNNLELHLSCHTC